ncbi:MAG TPA: polyphosphate kinase 2 [Rhizomicrobium sp.]|jgi:polyphosphate kinase 2|nr:polyphosphate kinase 2 [Rhizomicrobium sp.]
MAKSAQEPEQDKHYGHTLYDLQVELVKLQRKLIAENRRVLVIIEGRDGAGKDGTIKRLTEHMSPRETRIHAPGKPSSREETEWYFQRFVPFLPAATEFVVFNRSWYNRAGVELVMGFCTKEQVEAFFESVVPFEAMLMRDGIAIRKYYLDISRDEQKERLEARAKDPLKQWKLSPVDAKALKNWKAYSAARDEMFRRSSHAGAPWRIVKADVKKVARLELLRDLLASFDYDGKSKKLTRPDPSIVFPWSENAAEEIAV